MTNERNEREIAKTAERDEEIARLAQELKSRSQRTRELAARRLGELNGPAALLLPLVNDSDLKVRTAVVAAFGSATLGDQAEEVYDALMSAIDDPVASVSVSAVRSLGLQRAMVAHDEIVACLHDRDESVVRAAILALGRLGQSEDVPLLFPYLDHPHMFLVAAAVRALTQLNSTDFAPRALQLLHASLPQADARRDAFELASNCINALGRLRVKAGVEVLADIASNHVGLRALAVKALSQIGSRLDDAILENMMAGPDGRLRNAAIGMVMAPEGRPDLAAARRLLQHEGSDVRQAALALVREERDVEAAEQVRWICYRDSNPYLRPVAVATLRDLLGADSLQDMLRLARDPNPLVRQAAVAGLALFPELPEAAFAVLREAASDESLRQVASEVLVRFGQVMPEIPQATMAVSDGPEAARPSLVPDIMCADRRLLIELLERWQTALLDQRGARVVRVHGAIAALLDALREHDKLEAEVATLAVQGKPIE